MVCLLVTLPVPMLQVHDDSCARNTITLFFVERGRGLKIAIEFFKLRKQRSAAARVREAGFNLAGAVRGGFG